MQDDKSFDVKYPRTVASREIEHVAGQCLAVNVKYLHSMPFGSEFYLGVIFGNRAIEYSASNDTDGKPSYSTHSTYATEEYLEVKARSCFHTCQEAIA